MNAWLSSIVVALFAWLPAFAQAADFPTQAVRIVVPFALASLRIDDDQGSVDDPEHRAAIVGQIHSGHQNSQVPQQPAEARIIGLQLRRADGTDRMAITLPQQQPDQFCGVCECHCFPASRE